MSYVKRFIKIKKKARKKKQFKTNNKLMYLLDAKLKQDLTKQYRAKLRDLNISGIIKTISILYKKKKTRT